MDGPAFCVWLLFWGLWNSFLSGRSTIIAKGNDGALITGVLLMLQIICFAPNQATFNRLGYFSIRNLQSRGIFISLGAFTEAIGDGALWKSSLAVNPIWQPVFLGKKCQEIINIWRDYCIFGPNYILESLPRIRKPQCINLKFFSDNQISHVASGGWGQLSTTFKD